MDVEEALATDYQYCPASTATVLKGLGAGKKGDLVEGVIITPLTLAPGAVTLKDGSDAARRLFFGGLGAAGLNSELRPWFLPLGARSRVGAWTITCGANVQAIAVGRFQ